MCPFNAEHVHSKHRNNFSLRLKGAERSLDQVICPTYTLLTYLLTYEDFL